MPTRAIPGWTQQPIIGADLRSIHFDRVDSGTNNWTVTASYQVRDEAASVRHVKSVTVAVTSWPASLAAVLAGINNIEGT